MGSLNHFPHQHNQGCTFVISVKHGEAASIIGVMLVTLIYTTTVLSCLGPYLSSYIPGTISISCFFVCLFVVMSLCCCSTAVFTTYCIFSSSAADVYMH